MISTIDVNAMPVADRLRLMEFLWDSLCAPTEGGVESPAWHEAALKQAEDEMAAGTARLVDWAEAKDGLRRNGRT